MLAYFVHMEQYADGVGVFYSHEIHGEMREHECRIQLLKHLWRNRRTHSIPSQLQDDRYPNSKPSLPKEPTDKYTNAIIILCPHLTCRKIREYKLFRLLEDLDELYWRISLCLTRFQVMQVVFFCPNNAMCTMFPGAHLLERLIGGGGGGGGGHF